MIAEERRQKIVSLLQTEGRVLVSSLSKQFKVSQITIRKDLDSLHSRGLVQRSHGGALAPSSSALFDPSLREKQLLHAEEKRRIAVAAAKMVQEGSCVMLDSGTTTAAIAEELKKFSALTVITNAINIAAELASTNLEVILTGGTLRKNSFSLVGPIAEDVLSEMHADIVFLGVDGFDPEIGLTTPNLLESRVNRAMISSATKVVAVCDSTKFYRRSLSRIVPVSALHHIITDHGIPHATAESLRKMNIGLTLV
ncbi:MAG TPA: transcriptional repressor AgaR [Terriglobia bacterium]|nr:transcriptional repressor AgaR [Terriglobia bacterium]